jgi:hypothetical protein
MTRAALLLVALAACSNEESHGAAGPGALGGAGAGQILVAVSGEALALNGYAFPPASSDDVAFVDGWSISLKRVIVTVDHVTLSDNPDLVPTDQSQSGGVVAQIDGPWAIDLHQGGPLPGKGGAGEQAVPIATFTSKNRASGDPFDPTRRYAAGFDLVAASADAKNVNLDADGSADYEQMKRDGTTALYVGTATWNGGSSCTSSDATYDFSKLPVVVDFRFAFKTPATYVNCQNPDNDPARPLAGEEHLRGVQVKTNVAVVSQVTVHTDHLFWEALEHDAPLHFDPFVARLIPDAQGHASMTLDDLTGVDFTTFKDARGKYLPWRSCVGSYSPPRGAVFYDSKSVPVNPAASPDRALRDFRDYVAYAESTSGHLNADGLCFVRRNYPSPP